VDPSLYLDRDTWVHRLDPRTKMFLLLGMFALPFVFLDPLYELAVLALVLFFGYLARALVNLRRIWFILLTILVVTTILWSIFGSGRTPLFLFVEREALLYGLSIALRIVITVIAGMIFLSTTRNEEVGIGLVRLGIPYRFAFAVSTALRLVPTVVATGLTISQAQRSRSWCRSSSRPSARPTSSPWRWSPRGSGPVPGARSFSTPPWARETCSSWWRSWRSWQRASRCG
jgi:energy-coupling factor transport system permease protein